MTDIPQGPTGDDAEANSEDLSPVEEITGEGDQAPAEGQISTVEEIAYVETSDIASIQGLDEDTATLLQGMVRAKLNLVVSGGTSDPSSSLR